MSENGCFEKSAIITNHSFMNMPAQWNWVGMFLFIIKDGYLCITMVVDCCRVAVRR